ncbi:dTDP-glucose 4,6-dehydratase [Marinicrinis sediminis]|uniref:dTDP-glucose 4,6-dehydratase n=1 Tax=Marinicrinis sediminis TaxID=1652465 RepID=A0ABW5RAC0_9BACL
MRVLVTGGAGFIGRWVVKKLLEDGHAVSVIDDLSNGSEKNLEEFRSDPFLQSVVIGDIKNQALIDELFAKHSFEICYHLGASINVQDSIDDPKTTFQNDTVGTFCVLEACRKHHTKMVLMSTCMVYERCTEASGLTEAHPVKPASPYAGAKIAAESMTLSYFHAYGLPAVVVRPFNTYGPYQKTSGEGGVVSIFVHQKLLGADIQIYGDGTQTRDLLYVEDCADFVVSAGYSDRVNGQVVHAGTGQDIAINELAQLIAQDHSEIKHVPHIHPQSEIQKLLCNPEKAKQLLGWEATTPLTEGIRRTEEWIRRFTRA